MATKELEAYKAFRNDRLLPDLQYWMEQVQKEELKIQE